MVLAVSCERGASISHDPFPTHSNTDPPLLTKTTLLLSSTRGGGARNHPPRRAYLFRNGPIRPAAGLIRPEAGPSVQRLA